MPDETPIEDRPPEPDDAELIHRARDGNGAAFDELVRRYQARVYSVVYHMTGNREDTEDIVQDVFLRVYRSLARFREDSSFYTWLYRIAVNRAINYIKKRNRRRAFSLNDVDLGIERDEAYIELSSRESPFRDTGLQELSERLNKALQKLSEKHRRVVVLHDIQGLPHEQIAEIERCSPGTIRSRLFYARQQLQAELSDYIE